MINNQKLLLLLYSDKFINNLYNSYNMSQNFFSKEYNLILLSSSAAYYSSLFNTGHSKIMPHLLLFFYCYRASTDNLSRLISSYTKFAETRSLGLLINGRSYDTMADCYLSFMTYIGFRFMTYFFFNKVYNKDNYLVF